MGKEIVNKVHEAQRFPYRINPRRNTPRNILIKLSKIKYKEKIVKAVGKSNKYRIHFLLKCAWNILQDRSCLGHKSSLSKFKKIEIVSSIFSDHNTMRLDINYRKKKNWKK